MHPGAEHPGAEAAHSDASASPDMPSYSDIVGSEYDIGKLVKILLWHNASAAYVREYTVHIDIALLEAYVARRMPCPLSAGDVRVHVREGPDNTTGSTAVPAATAAAAFPATPVVLASAPTSVPVSPAEL